MNWRNLTIGAFLTLLVTIVGGVLVVWLTRAPAPAERIVYTIDEPVKFEANETKISLVSAKVANVGNQTASSVTIVMDTGDETSIVAHKLPMSSGSAVQYGNISVEDNRISVSLQALVPREVLTISAMLNGIIENQPRLSARSASSFGEPGELISDNDNDTWSLVRTILIPLVTLLYFGIVYWIWRRRLFQEHFGNINNLAFLYIHQGLVEEAAQVLERYINNRGASAYELLNYGLALALTGKNDEAKKLFAAGEWVAKSKYARGLAEFNKSIACIAIGDVGKAREHLRKAFELSPRQILRYCGFSVHIKDAISKDEGTAQIIESYRS